MALLDKYPVDVMSLNKGQLITVDQLKIITGKDPADASKWAFAVLGLRDFIHSKTDLCVRITGEGIRILTDSEASQYNHRKFQAKLEGATSTYSRNTRVDEANLTTDERSKHQRNLLVESRYVSAMHQVGRKISIEAHQRSTPMLPASESAD